MAERPHTRYVTVGDADVAYQIVGEGPRDLLWCYGLTSNIELVHEAPITSTFLDRLTSFSRVLLMDCRGAGASQHIDLGTLRTWEEWTHDIEAVLDAAGSARASIFAGMDAGPVVLLFAATHPDRVESLTLLNTYAKYVADDSYPIGASPEFVDTLLEWVRTGWGTPEFARLVSPSEAIDDGTYERLARQLRSAATPRGAAAHFEYVWKNEDARAALSLIQAPTLVLHVRDSPVIGIEHGRYLADNVPGARLFELPGSYMGISEDGLGIADEIGEFVAGSRYTGPAERILASVMFSDIVDSTAQAAKLGDRQWHQVLDRHDQAVRDELRRHRGREINTTGDGFVASFDGPARAIRCAEAIIDSVSSLGIKVRTGLHTGECEVRGDDLGGVAVHIAARVAAQAKPREVLVSGTVKDLVVGSGIKFTDRGEHELKGVPGSWKLFAVAR